MVDLLFLYIYQSFYFSTLWRLSWKTPWSGSTAYCVILQTCRGEGRYPRRTWFLPPCMSRSTSQKSWIETWKGYDPTHARHHCLHALVWQKFRQTTCEGCTPEHSRKSGMLSFKLQYTTSYRNDVRGKEGTSPFAHVL